MAFPDLEGTHLPDGTLHFIEEGQLVTHDTASLFAGKKVIVFGLPGAFTPTCSTQHVPRYNQLFSTFRELGVDDILCVSVNDAFVMDAWQQQQDADRLRFAADGNGNFTDALGLLVDKSQIGFGKRSWRYAMLVDDGVITKQFLEPDQPGDPYVVSDADTMLAYLGGSEQAPHDVLLFTRPGCGHCARAKRALRDADVRFEEVRATGPMLRAVSDTPTTPRVFVDGSLLGGADELTSWLAAR